MPCGFSFDTGSARAYCRHFHTLPRTNTLCYGHGVHMVEPTLDIFRGAIGSGEEVWLEAVCGRLKAQRRMEQIAAAKPGLYFVLNVHDHIIVGCADTRRHHCEELERLRQDAKVAGLRARQNDRLSQLRSVELRKESDRRIDALIQHLLSGHDGKPCPAGDRPIVKQRRA